MKEASSFTIEALETALLESKIALDEETERHQMTRADAES